MIQQYNLDVRKEIAGSGLRLWHVAEALGIPDSSLSRKLRRELPDAEKERIRDIITQLTAGREAGNDG